MRPSAGATWTWRRPSVLVAALYGVVVIARLATHAWDPCFFATVGPQWQRHDPDLAKQIDGMIFFDFATDPLAAAQHHGWLRMLDLWCHVRGLALARLTGWRVRPFAWLYRHVPAVRRHGYLITCLAQRRSDH